MTPPPQDAARIALEFLTEAYEGPPEGWSWFVNAAPDAGVFGAIEPLTAAQASRPLAPGGRSIAAHAEHLRWSLDLTDRTLRGAPWNPDWEQSWTVRTVTDEQWAALKAALRDAYGRVKATLESGPDLSNPMMLRGICALAPHAAHHLGTIRTIAKVVTEG